MVIAARARNSSSPLCMISRSLRRKPAWIVTAHLRSCMTADVSIAALSIYRLRYVLIVRLHWVTTLVCDASMTRLAASLFSSVRSALRSMGQRYVSLVGIVTGTESASNAKGFW